MRRRERAGKRVRSMEAGFRRACYSLLVVSVLLLLVSLIPLGGLTGRVGTVLLILTFFSLVLAGLSALLWGITGTVAEWLAPVLRRDAGVRVETDFVAHAEEANPSELGGLIRELLLARGEEWETGIPPNEFLTKVERAREVEPFLMHEASSLFPVVASAAVSRSPGLSWYEANEEAEARLGTVIPRLRVVPGTETRREKLRAPKPSRSGAFTAVDPTVDPPRFSLEHGFGIAAFFAGIGFFLLKGFLLFFSVPGSGSSKPGWAISLGISFIVTLSLNWLLRWRRKRAAEWLVRPTETGFRAESRRFAGRHIDVDAEDCWAMVQQSRLDGVLFRPHLQWTFVFREPPGVLGCDEFNHEGTRWQAWLGEWNAAVDEAESVNVAVSP